MTTKAWGRRGVIPSLGAGLGLATVLALGGASAGVSTAGGPPPAREPNDVLTGAYSCTYSVTSYLVVPDQPPTTYAETSDSLTMSTTGGLVPTRTGAGATQIGPGFGARVGFPLILPVSGFGTGHSFTDGSIEDCVRSAQSMAAAASGLGCATSAVHRRQPPEIAIYSPSASFSFVCEDSAADLVHAMGVLSRAVLALSLQPAP